MKTMKLLISKSFVGAILLLSFALILVGCERKPAGTSASVEGGGKKKVVGFAQMENNGPWRIAETKSMSDEAAKRGYELVATDAQTQTSKQISDVEDMVARRVG